MRSVRCKKQEALNLDFRCYRLVTLGSQSVETVMMNRAKSNVRRLCVLRFIFKLYIVQDEEASTKKEEEKRRTMLYD